MKKCIGSLPLLIALICWSGQARAEWFYLGAHLGGEYFDLDALRGGDVFAQALGDATESLNAQGSSSIDQPKPVSYSSAGSFVWGLYTGVSLGRWVQLGARFTHSWMDVEPEGGELGGTNVGFELQLITIMGEFMLRIPIRFIVPFVGFGIGFAYMKSDTTIISGDQSATSELGTSGIDVMGTLGIDFNIGDHFAIGFAAQFSFIGFYYEAGLDTEFAWGFVNDYMGRITFRL